MQYIFLVAAESHPSLPASTTAVPFHHIPALQSWWQIFIFKAALHKSVFKRLWLKTGEEGPSGVLSFIKDALPLMHPPSQRSGE